MFVANKPIHLSPSVELYVWSLYSKYLVVDETVWMFASNEKKKKSKQRKSDPE